MDVSSAINSIADSRSAKSSATLAGDFESFLSLLTTQLRQQDPLSPMDAEKFTSQLVQFSSVEQAIETNRRLSEMTKLLGGNALSDALSFVGREVELAGDGVQLGAIGGAQLALDVPPDAQRVDVSILDSSGTVVRRLEGPIGAGSHQLNWDGLRNDGVRAAAGSYRLVATAITEDGRELDATARPGGIVDAVETIGGTPRLVIEGIRHSIEDVRSVRLAEAA